MVRIGVITQVTYVASCACSSGIPRSAKISEPCQRGFTQQRPTLNERNVTLANNHLPCWGLPLQRLPEPYPKTLAALIVYERPCDRSRLLRDIASLGIFVIERSRDMRIEGQAYDLAIALVLNTEAYGKLLCEVSKNGTIPTIAVLPGVMGAYGELSQLPYVSAIAHDEDRSLQAAIQSTMAPVGEIKPTVAGMTLLQDTEGPDGEWIPSRLSPAERRVLALLIEAKGQPVPQEALASTSTSKPNLSEAYLKTLIFRLRRKLATSLGDGAPTIAAVRGYGYVLRKAVYSPAASPETSAR